MSQKSMSTPLRLLVLCVSLQFSTQVFAFETLEDFSPISNQADAEKPGLFLTADSVLVDGAVTSFPPDQTTYDRTLVNILRFGTNLNFTNRFSLRFILDARYYIHKISEEEEPRRLIEEEWFDGRPTLDARFTTARGIEIFGGLMYWLLPEYEQTTESVTFETTTTYGEAYLPVPRAGFWKRSSNISAGAFYQPAASRDRSVKKVASDGSEVNAKEKVFQSEQIGLLLRFVVASFSTDAEFTAVQAGSSSPKTEQEGEAILEDYFKIRVASIVPWDRKTLNFYLAIIHKTLSYSDSAYMSLETIPMTTAHFKIIRGNLEKHVFAGLVYGYAEDTQSLPEFNQKYKINAYGAKLGFNYQF